MRAIFDSVAYGRYRPGTPPEGAFNPIGPYRVRNFHSRLGAARVVTSRIV